MRIIIRTDTSRCVSRILRCVFVGGQRENLEARNGFANYRVSCRKERNIQLRESFVVWVSWSMWLQRTERLQTVTLFTHRPRTVSISRNGSTWKAIFFSPSCASCINYQRFNEHDVYFKGSQITVLIKNFSSCFHHPHDDATRIPFGFNFSNKFLAT